LSKHKPSDEPKAAAAADDGQPGTSTITDTDLAQELDVFEYDPAQEHALLTAGEALMLTSGGRVGGVIDFIGNLLNIGWVADALNLLKLLSDRTTPIGAVIDAVEAILAKMSTNVFPKPPKKMLAGKRPTKDEILQHLDKAGVNVSFIPTPLLGLIISLAMQFGLPIIQKIIEGLLNRQKLGHQSL